MFRRSYRNISAGVGAAVFAVALAASAAAAPTYEQILEGCKSSVRPQVQACMQGKRGTGDRESNLAACRAGVTGTVKACVQRESQKAAAGKAAPAIPKEEPVAGAKDVAPVAAGFVAPPRTIADITAVLDSEKPDAAKIEERKEAADAPLPKGLSPTDLAQFYYDRASARALLSRNQDALDDAAKAMAVAGLDIRQRNRVRQMMAIQYVASGDPKKAVAIYQETIRDSNQPYARGGMINASRAVAQVLVSMGDVAQADAYTQRVLAVVQEARGSPVPSWRKAYAVYGRSWEADGEAARALVLEARGQYRDAENAYKRSEAFRRASLKDNDNFDYPVPPEQIVLSADGALLSAGFVKAKQGRLAEAEADVRRALLSVLKNQGKYNPSTTRFISGLASILVEQGRYNEAVKLIRTSLDVQRTMGMREDSPLNASTLSQLGNVLVLEGKQKDASEVYAELEKALASWEPRRRDAFLLNNSRISALYAAGQVEAGIAAAKELVKKQLARVGEKHFDTAGARGTLAIGYLRAGRVAEALVEFKAAIPILMAAARENADDDDTTVVAARNQRLQGVIEAYIGALAKGESGGSADVANETFALADAIRGHSVQQALAASSARTVAKDPALADLVRAEQDLAKQVSAQLGTLNNVLALPSNERDEKGVAAINASIDKLRADREKARQEINRRFPAYADLVDPKPPTVDQIKATLRPGEALLSYYFGQTGSFVWAVPKDGPVVFAAVNTTALELEAKVRKLREALEPQAATIGDIPPFDLALAYELYGLLLQPVEGGWKPAKDLIVVTNGALGLLPLSLLPTAPSEVKDGDGPLFAGYRNVPWLARTHAVTMVPSVAALRTLRQIPPSASKREPMIGFGDPLFSKEQAEQAAKPTDAAPVQVAALATRGLPLKRRSAPQLDGVESADLALLPRLPDTADELRAIAVALEADPAKVLNLGINANEKLVKSTDLSKYKILVFATHGLVPGELNGLLQPALALSAPDVANVDGDGLLTMEEILALKLDADWVVLSACNTGTGAGAGAEAASGLGRAFFYAGTRALLVTNWSVHSQSARELTSDLFRRQSVDPKLTRGEALRQAMMALVDGPGLKSDSGEALVAYAHPLFWAPYTIIGDGGGVQ